MMENLTIEQQELIEHAEGIGFFDYPPKATAKDLAETFEMNEGEVVRKLKEIYKILLKNYIEWIRGPL